MPILNKPQRSLDDWKSIPGPIAWNLQRHVQRMVYKNTVITDNETIPYLISRKLCSTQMPNTAS